MSERKDPDPLGAPLARAAFEATPAGLLVLTTDGTVVAVNAAFCALYGIDAPAVVGRHHSAFTADLQVRRLGDDVGPESWVTLRALEGERVEDVLQAVRNKRTGVEFYARCGAVPVYEDGRLVATTVTVEDVTEHARAQQAIEGALSAAEVGTYRIDLVAATAWGDANFARIHGLTEEDVRGGPLARVHGAIHPDDRERVIDAVREAAEADRSHEVEYRVLLPGGGVRWLLSRGRAELNGDGKAVARLGSIVDLTDRKRAEAESLRSADRSRALSEATATVVFVADADGRLTEIPVSRGLYERAAGAGLGSGWLEVVHPDDRESAVAAWGKAVAGGDPYAAEFRLRMADGSYRWHAARGVRVADEGGGTREWVGALIDAHERAVAGRLDAALAGVLDPEHVVQALTDVSTEAVGAEFGSFFYARPEQEPGPDGGARFGLYALSGAPPEAFAGFPPVRSTPLFAPTFRGEGVVRSDDVALDPRFSGMPEGHLPVRSYLAVPVRDRDGEVLGGLLFGHSRAGRFTEEHQRLVESFAARAAVAYENAVLYERLREANEGLERRVEERTAELTRANRDLNEFSYSVAHDLRAPLRAVVATSRILLEDAGDRLDASERATLERQATNAVRLAKIVDDLLRFARLAKADLHKQSFDMTRLARITAEEVGARREDGCVVEAQEGMRALGDPSLVGYVLTNLLDNACKFSPDGGTVSVGEEGGAFFVRDQGIGFDARHAHKLFVAFERLVGQEIEGTGVGLANVRRIVEKHGGRVWAESEPGKGATFWFTLG